MKFGFIMRSLSSRNTLLYDGNIKNKRLAFDGLSAEKWFKNIEPTELKTHRFVLGQQVSVTKFPLLEEGKEINEELTKFLKEAKGMSPSLQRMWGEFLKKYEAVEKDGFVGFRVKENVDESSEFDDLPNGGLARMKDFIMGLARFDSVKIANKSGGKDKYIDFDIHQHFRGNSKIPYVYKGEKNKTPVYGVFAPQLRKMMFDDMMDFGDGRNLQKWQIKLLYEMGMETYVAASRGAGKSILASALASRFSARTPIDPRERIDGSIVHVYGLSHASNKAIVNKILTLNSELRDGSLFKRSSTDRIMYFQDGNTISGWIEFLSDEQDEPGRGGRPRFIVFDEAARLSQNVKDIADGNSNIPKLYISTIDYETKKNWFYDGLIEAELEQIHYKETMDDLVVRLWKKYKLEEYKSPQAVYDDNGKVRKEFVKVLADIRSEFFEARPKVAMRVTLDDVEYKDKKEKDSIIREKMKRGMGYLLAEEYSEYLDESGLFQFDRCLMDTDKLPDAYDYIVMGFDFATSFDNPALCVGGVRSGKVYILESLRLPKNDIEMLERLKTVIGDYKRKNQRLFLVADVTQAKHEQRYFLENRGIDVDVPLYITNGGESRVDTEGFYIVGKRLLVNIGQDFFDRQLVQIPPFIHSEDGGLTTEIQLFQETETSTGRSKYEAIKGKDDQVLAMLYVLFFLHSNGFREKIADSDNLFVAKNTMQDEDYYDKIERENYAKSEKARLKKAYNELFSSSGY